MKRFLAIALGLGVVVSSGLPLQAQDAPRIAKYVPAGPDSRHVFVTDSAHILSDATIRALQDSAQALQTATGADVAWVTLPTLGGRSIEEATVYLGRTWKIGSVGQPGDPLRNRGLVILYVPDKSKTAGSNFRVEVGSGLQGTIIDSRSRAISTAMRDDLRARRYDAGYLAGWNVAAAMVRADYASSASGRTAVRPERPTASTSSPTRLIGVSTATVLAILAVLAVIATVVALIRRQGSRAGMPSPMLLALAAMSDDTNDDDSRRRNADSSWRGSDSGGDSGSSGDSGGDLGGGGGFDGGGSSDSI